MASDPHLEGTRIATKLRSLAPSATPCLFTKFRQKSVQSNPSDNNQLTHKHNRSFVVFFLAKVINQKNSDGKAVYSYVKNKKKCKNIVQTFRPLRV